jgi:pimeloyl-ACP methyl ester carboxylesterase
MTVEKQVVHGREKGVRFGASSSLVGVLTEAAPSSSSAGRPAVIFLNSGILHRVGSCRLHVRMARAFSAAGFHSLRFDFSGIGDSDQRRDSLSFEESAVVETREAMDYIAKAKGVQSFILIGLCSGADMAHETAVADERVAGLLLLDAWAYKNLAYKVRRYGPRLLDVRAWKHSIGIRWRMLRGTHKDTRLCVPGSEGVEYEVPKYVRVFPPRERVERDLQGFVARGIAMYNIWTGGLEEYNHEGQHAATFRDVPFNGRLREQWIPDADHIVTGLEHQERVTAESVSWLCEICGVTPAVALETGVRNTQSVPTVPAVATR